MTVPISRALAQTPDTPLEDASPGARFVNLIIDEACLSAVFLLVAKIVEGEQTLRAMNSSLPILVSILILLVLILLRLIYYVGFETLFGRTPGKFLTGTRVVRDDGGKPTLGAILGRTLIRFIPFEAFSFLVSDTGWHDRWSDTRVVSTTKGASQQEAWCTYCAKTTHLEHYSGSFETTSEEARTVRDAYGAEIGRVSVPVTRTVYYSGTRCSACSREPKDLGAETSQDYLRRNKKRRLYWMTVVFIQMTFDYFVTRHLAGLDRWHFDKEFAPALQVRFAACLLITFGVRLFFVERQRLIGTWITLAWLFIAGMPFPLFFYGALEWCLAQAFGFQLFP